MIQFKVKLLSGGYLPQRKSEQAAGWDLKATTSATLGPAEIKIINCGFCMELPEDCEAQVRPRSGLATKEGLSVVFGTIDADYRGEICVMLHNTHPMRTVSIKAGDRVAQMIVRRLEPSNFLGVKELSKTSRGDDGFGSTGKN